MVFFSQIDAYLAAYNQHNRLNAYQRTLTPDERKEMAMELGVSETEWNKVQESYKLYLKNAKALRTGGYESLHQCIEVYKKMEAIFPPNANLNYAVAEALHARWKSEVKEEDIIEARRYVLAALDLAPNHRKANKLLNKFDDKKIQKEKKDDKFWTGCGCAVLILIGLAALALLWYIGSSGWNFLNSSQ